MEICCSFHSPNTTKNKHRLCAYTLHYSTVGMGPSKRQTILRTLTFFRPFWVLLLKFLIRILTTKRIPDLSLRHHISLMSRCFARHMTLSSIYTEGSLTLSFFKSPSTLHHTKECQYRWRRSSFISVVCSLHCKWLTFPPSKQSELFFPCVCYWVCQNPTHATHSQNTPKRLGDRTREKINFMFIPAPWQ